MGYSFEGYGDVEILEDVTIPYRERIEKYRETLPPIERHMGNITTPCLGPMLRINEGMEAVYRKYWFNVEAAIPYYEEMTRVRKITAISIKNKIVLEQLRAQYPMDEIIHIGMEELYDTFNNEYICYNITDLVIFGAIKEWKCDGQNYTIRFKLVQDNKYTTYEAIESSIGEEAVKNYKYQEKKKQKSKEKGIKRDNKGFVYFIYTTLGIKIGLSSKYKERVADITAKLPVESEYITVYKVNDRFKAEKRLHKEFIEKHIRGEWFKIDKEDIKRAGSIVEQEFSGEKVQ